MGTSSEMIAKLFTVSILGAINIGQVESSSLLHVVCFPYVKHPTVKALHNVDHILTVAIKQTVVAPREPVLWAKSKKQTLNQISQSVVFAYPLTVF